ncbi:TonB family protein [Seohaeicola saemankumensis]|nr:energy transducer TonB [Seohaeicola saemankumensis]MCA0873153.1 TonB family protein [Seohaeicola saemankumensis]
MIRRSTAIATVAVLLSLLAHVLGLGFAPPSPPQRSGSEQTADVVTLATEFEDHAESRPDPVQPEAAEVPEPPVQKPAEPDRAEIPTSEALVASARPERVFAPDNGSSRVIQRDATGPATPDKAGSPQPDTVAPTGGDDGTETKTTATPPVTPATGTDQPAGTPEATVDTVAPAPPVAPQPAPQSQAVAALPEAVAPVPPVSPTLDPAAILVAPVDSETVEPSPETPETDPDGSALAVVASPRPRPRQDRPAEPARGAPDGVTDYSDLKNPPLIESPLAAYLRGQGDLEVRQNAATQSGGVGFRNSRGPGNSDVTNYAGQILMHLNRAPAVRVSAHGYARVFFEINPDGSLAWVEVIDGTNSPEIERAAKAQVRGAAPFPPPPQGVNRKLSFVYHID